MESAGSLRAVVALAFAALACALAAPGAVFADWPMYGHDLSNSRNAGRAGPPLAQVPSITEAWKFDSPTGDFTATPVVARGVLVAGDNAGWVYALDAATGKVMWSRHVGQAVNGSAAIDIHAPGGPTVYVPVGALSRPRLVALSLASGAVRWDRVLSTQTDATVFGSPVFWRRTVYIGTSGPNSDNSHARGSVVAIAERTGRIDWRTFTVPPGSDGAAVWSTPAIDTATGRLYVGTGNNYHDPATGMEDSILAIAAGSGRIVDHFQATSGDTFSAPGNPAGPDEDFGSSPNLITGPGGEALVGAGQKSGTYWALDRRTMRPVWKATAGPGSPVGGFLGSTAYDKSRVYGANTVSGQVVALTRGGSTAWHSADAGGLHWSPTTIANHVLYTADASGFVTARNPATGAIVGKLPLGAPTFGGIAAAGGALYVSVGIGPPPAPAPQRDGHGSIIAFGNTQPQDRASSFSGSCSLSGSVSFTPPLTTSPQPVDQSAHASGTCSGTFVDRQGKTHQLSGAPASYVGSEHGDSASCGAGTDEGSGRLEFPEGTIRFSISEVRGAAVVAASLTGTAGGSAKALAEPSQSQDPATLQQCAGAGIQQAKIDIHAQTTPTISG